MPRVVVLVKKMSGWKCSHHLHFWYKWLSLNFVISLDPTEMNTGIPRYLGICQECWLLMLNQQKWNWTVNFNSQWPSGFSKLFISKIFFKDRIVETEYRVNTPWKCNLKVTSNFSSSSAWLTISFSLGSALIKVRLRSKQI